MCVSKSCIEFIFRKLCNLKGGPYISMVVRKFQCISEILVPGGPHISKYLDRGGGGEQFWGGSKFIMTSPAELEF